MKDFWYEKCIGNIAFFFGTLGWLDFKIGITLGRENTIYLGFICFGFDI